MIATTTATTPDWLAVLIVLAAPAAALAGVFATMRIESRRQRATRERDEDVKREERARRSADYQRTTLQGLQEALVDLLDATFTVAWPDEAGVRTGQEVRRQKASAQVTMLTQRVVDDDARAAVDEVAMEMEKLIRQDIADRRPHAAREAQDRAQGAIGEVLRSLP